MSHVPSPLPTMLDNTATSAPEMNINQDEFSLLCRILSLRWADVAAIAEGLRLLDMFGLLPVHLQAATVNLHTLLGGMAAELPEAQLEPTLSTGTECTSPVSTWPTPPSTPFSLVPYRQSACVAPSELDNDFVNTLRSPLSGPQSPLSCSTAGNSHLQSVCVDPSQLGTRLSSPDLPQPQPPRRARQSNILEVAGGEVLPKRPRANKDCTRGTVPLKNPSRKKWGYRLSPYTSSSDQVDGLVAELAAAHWGSSVYDVETWVSNVRQLVGEQTDMFQDQSLCSVVLRCACLQARDIQVNFLSMINLIQLVCKCQSIRRSKRAAISLSQIYYNELRGLPGGPVLSTFLDWHATGSRFAALAGAGSVYLLVLIAGLGLRVAIGSMSGNAPFDLASIIRAPVKADHRQLIRNFIAPTIAQMKRALPLNMDTLFSPSLQEEHGISGVAVWHEWSQSDDFFDSVSLNCSRLANRDSSIWGSLIDPIVQSVPPILLNQLTYGDIGPPCPYSPPLSNADDFLPTSPH